MNTVQKRKETIQKKNELKEAKKIIFKNKTLLKGSDTYRVFQTKYIRDENKQLVEKALKLIKSPFKHASDLRLKYKNQPDAVTQYKIDGLKTSKAQIKKQADDIRKLYKKNGFNVSVEISLHYKDGWHSGKVSNMNQDVDIYDPITYNSTELNSKKIKIVDQEYFSQYDIFVIKEPKTRNVGYDDKNNDCLYNCLIIAICNTLPWKKPEEFKTFLKLSYNSKVNIKYIPIIEKHLKKYKINVYGDDIYISSINSNRIINLNFINGHATLKNSTFSNNIKMKVAFKDKQILLYNRKTFYGYDGEKEWFITKEELNDIYKNKTNYIIVNKDNNDKTFDLEYKELIVLADNLKKESNNKLNIYRTGNYVTTSLNLFDTFNKTIQPEPIDQLEGKFINGALCGALIFSNKYNGPLYDYDFVSHYPAILLSNMLLPIKKGIFNTITQDEFNEKIYYAYGIYKCIITPSDNLNTNKLFRFNKNNYYTSNCLKMAKELNLEVKIIEGEANFLYYPSIFCIKACNLFKEFIDIVYPLKQKNIDGAKLILTSLWGALSEKKKYKHCIQNNDEFIINDNHNIESIKRLDDNKYLLKISNNEQLFKYDFGRIAPFIVSEGRNKLSKVMMPFIDKIVFCHTDGFNSIEKLNIETEDKIGCLKYKGSNDNAYINNCNDRTRNFLI